MGLTVSDHNVVGNGGTSIFGIVPGTDGSSPSEDNVGNNREYFATPTDARKPASELSLSYKGTELLKNYESYKQYPYNDNPDVKKANATIGYGDLLHYGPINAQDKKDYPNGITKEEATTRLQSKLAPYENVVKTNVTRKLYQYEYDALVLFQYNTHGLVGSTLLKRVNANETADKVTEGFLMFNKITNRETKKKEVSTGLTNRRTDEAELFNTGDYIRNH